VPKFWEGTQCECTSVAAFFSWSFLPPNSQSPPTINVLLLTHFLVCHFCGKIVRVRPMLPHFLSSHFWAQIVTVHRMWMHWCFRIFQWVISVQCEHTKCEWLASDYIPESSVYPCWSFFTMYLRPSFFCMKCSSAPDVSSSQVIMYLHQPGMMLSPSPPHHFPFLHIWSIPPHTIPTTFYLSIMNFKGVQTWVGGDTPHALSYFAFFTAFPFSPSSRSLPSHIGASQMHHILLS